MGWTPRGSKNKKLIRERWAKKQQREYLKSLTPKQLNALRRVLADSDEGVIPENIGDPTLNTWERVRERGRVLVDAVIGERG